MPGHTPTPARLSTRVPISAIAASIGVVVAIALGTGCEQQSLHEEISLLREENQQLRDHIKQNEGSRPAASPATASGMSDVEMGSTVMAQPEATAPPVAPPRTAQPVTYTVRSGDTLSRIAREVYGTSAKWIMIYNANRRLIGPDYDRLVVGTELVMPAATGG
ncbi:MAG: LysM peptidoglycan-binding domain-containing protein [Planctomycetota bacterium]|jgi:LysM repeat protein